MKRLLFLGLAIFLATTIAVAGNQSTPQVQNHCDSFVKYGLPKDNTPNAVLICRTAYEVKYDPAAKIPVWVAYTLTASHAIGCVARSNAFAADKSLPEGTRSYVSDYAASGYDAGHIANDADMSWNENVERESFILSNIAPQTPELNRGIWRTLESAVRSWAYNSGNDIVVYAGSIYDVKDGKTIGPGKVVVPYAYYKIVIDTNKKQSLAFIFENSKVLGKDLSHYQVTVADVERATGIEFNVPDSKTDKNNIWTINTMLLNTAKKKLCNR